MIDSELFDLFTQDNIDKQAKIEYSGGVMTNEELFQNSEQLTESLCSGNELRFGCCEASCFKFKVANITKPLMGEQIKFSIVVDHLEDSSLTIGTYKVQSDTLTADRRHREVVAYDAMYDIINTDVAAWYDSVLPNKDSTVTLKQFREGFIRYFGLTEAVPEGGLVNDSMVVERTIEPEQISGKDVITAICEINGCFGHIGRDGKFHYIYLPQAIEGLYPSDDLFPDHAPEWMAQAKTGHLYPQDPKSTKIGTGTKISCEYKDFHTKPITKLQIRMKENDIGRVWPDGEILETDNCYIIQDNFLVYGKSHEELGVIAQNIFSKITDIVYRPFNAYCAGNPCFEVGDPVRLTTKYDIIESYILKRTMKGIQALRDTYEAAGVEKYNEKVNGVNKSIIQLKGKTNVLERNVEETKSELKETEKNLRSTITQTATEIRAEVEDANNKLSSRISQTVKSISMSVTNGADGKTAEVKLLIEDEGGTFYDVMADKINFSGLVSFTNLKNDGETVINGNNITTGKLTSLVIDNGNGTFHVDKNGNVTANNIVATGEIVGVNGFSVKTEIGNARPPQYLTFVFAEAGKDIGGNPYLYINGPSGNRMIECGNIVYYQKPGNMKPYLVETPVFPNGIYAENAVVASLFQDHKEFNNISNGIDSVDFKIRISGCFVCIYGAYHTWSHPAGESKEIIIGNGTEIFLPTYHSVRTVGYYGKRSFVFVIDESGKFVARNASSSDVNISGEGSTATDIQFRFDFFRM